MWKFVVCCFFVFLMTVGAGSAMAASKIVFTQGVPSQIFVMNSDGSGLTNISNDSFYNREPSWSPDGSQIVFISDRASGSGDEDIYVMDADGSNVTRLTTDVGNEGVVDLLQKEWSTEYPASVASISPFGQFVIVFLLGGASALWMTRRQQAASPLTTT